MIQIHPQLLWLSAGVSTFMPMARPDTDAPTMYINPDSVESTYRIIRTKTDYWILHMKSGIVVAVTVEEFIKFNFLGE